MMLLVALTVLNLGTVAMTWLAAWAWAPELRRAVTALVRVVAEALRDDEEVLLGVGHLNETRKLLIIDGLDGTPTRIPVSNAHGAPAFSSVKVTISPNTLRIARV